MIAATSFGVFVFLAQSQVIIIPYFTSTTIQFENLKENYVLGEQISYTIRVKGYGSNCVSLKVSTAYYIIGGNENVFYFYKADDCRYVTITQGLYNYTRTFNYAGAGDLNRIGLYTIEAEFFDRINGQRHLASKSFTIKAV
jgi:hypothetical protein